MEQYECRKSTAVIKVIGNDGKPLANTRIHAKLTKHSFLFGCGAFFTLRLNDPDTPLSQRDYLDNIQEIWKSTFNYGTLSFHWARYEPEMGMPREKETLHAASLLAEEGKTVKGHPLCWHTVVPYWMYNMSCDEVLEYIRFRIRRELSVYRGKIAYWDVLNEPVIMPEFTNEPKSMPRMNPITRLCRQMGRVPMIKALFDEARTADPSVRLLLNDFNTSERYRQLIADCLDADVKIDAIGIQSHQHQGFWGMEKLQEVTERFESFGLPIHFTENTFVSGHLMPPEIVDLNDYQVQEWPTTPEGEARQAEDMKAMMEYIFSRPLVEAFTTWDFEDNQWLHAPSGLVRPDGTMKPGLSWLRDKLAGDWQTDTFLTTDEHGFISLHGFRGEYTLGLNNGATVPFTLGDQPPMKGVAEVVFPSHV